MWVTSKVNRNSNRPMSLANPFTAKATVRGIRAAAHAVMAALKAAVAAMQSLAAAILAGGWVAVVIILLICLIALVMGSSYGIFFGVESTGSGTSVSQAVRDLNQEYADHLQQISASVSHDRQEMTSNDGNLSINWQEVLAVFSAKVSGASDGEQVASLTDAQVDILRDILWEMNDVDYCTCSTESVIKCFFTIILPIRAPRKAEMTTLTNRTGEPQDCSISAA